MTGPTESALLAAVERSPAAAAAHDRRGWVGLFTEDGRVEDPVGSRPHTGQAEIRRFYDTFIGPRDDLRPVEGDWKITVLRAYWELPAMALRFLGNGVSALPAGVRLTRGLLRNQRVRGTAGFAAGFRRAGSRQKTLVDTFVNAVGEGDESAALQALSSGATVSFGDDEVADIAELIGRCRGARTTKLIAAGTTVAASVAAGQRRGVLFADLASHGKGIAQVRYFAQ